METGPRIAVALGLVGAAIAGVLYAFRKREVSAESDAFIDSFRLAESEPVRAPIEEVAVTARKIAAETVEPFARNTRGLRNKNPGNIRWIVKETSRWRGMLRDDGSGYAIFDTDANGVRALGKQLLVYARRGLDTVREIIGTWAPPSENATDAYIRAVSARLKVAPDAALDVSARLVDLANAIIYHENGRNPYQPADITKWVRLP